jgi:hypothetical protein
MQSLKLYQRVQGWPLSRTQKIRKGFLPKANHHATVRHISYGSKWRSIFRHCCKCRKGYGYSVQNFALVLLFESTEGRLVRSTNHDVLQLILGVYLLATISRFRDRICMKSFESTAARGQACWPIFALRACQQGWFRVVSEAFRQLAVPVATPTMSTCPC